jgi:hypothetical protein
VPGATTVCALRRGDWGVRPWGRGPKSSGWAIADSGLLVGVFVSDEVLLDVSFVAAQARLANVTRGGWLLSASQAAFDDGITGVARVGPLGSGPGISRRVQVHFRDLMASEGSALLTLRWEAIGPGGGCSLLGTPTSR